MRIMRPLARWIPTALAFATGLTALMTWRGGDVYGHEVGYGQLMTATACVGMLFAFVQVSRIELLDSMLQVAVGGTAVVLAILAQASYEPDVGQGVWFALGLSIAWTLAAVTASVLILSGVLGPPREEGSFLAALFDLSFRRFVYRQVASTVYCVGLIAVVMAAVLAAGVGFSESVGWGLLALLIAPLAGLLYLTLLRVTLEVFVVLFRMHDHLETLARTTEKSSGLDQATSAQSPYSDV